MERYKLFAIKAGAMNNEEKAQLCAILIKWGYTVRLVDVKVSEKKTVSVVEYWRENQNA